MQLLDRFERRIDQLVNGAFSHGVRAEVQPVEVAAAVQRELDDRAVNIFESGAVVPNLFSIDLSSRDFERLMAFEQQLCSELEAMAAEHAGARGYRTLGPIVVGFREDPALTTGLFRVNTEARAEAVVATSRSGPHLIVNGLTHPLTRHTTRIGRGTDVDIRIDDVGVSRHHAEIVLTSPITLRDLGSTNGTWVGKERITELALEHDTTITIGPANIEFRSR